MPPEPSPCQIILHIGGAKCGSSAIQAFLAQNADALAGRGVLLPGKELDFNSDITGEQIWAFEEPLGGAAFVTKLRDLFTEAEARGARQVILSAENICNHPYLAQVVERARGSRPVKVVFYVRRQDDYLISSWQQWHLKVFPSIESFLVDRVGCVANWNSMITPWADALGDENIIVRPFLRDHLKDGDAVADFCHAVGIDMAGLAPLTRRANPSYDEALGRLAHRVRDVFDGMHDNRFYEVMVPLLGEAALKREKASSLLSIDTRHRILHRYAEENEALKERFLPDWGDEPLFLPPRKSDVRIASEEEKNSEDLAMLTRAIYALAEQNAAPP